MCLVELMNVSLVLKRTKIKSILIIPANFLTDTVYIYILNTHAYAEQYVGSYCKLSGEMRKGEEEVGGRREVLSRVGIELETFTRETDRDANHFTSEYKTD